MIQLIKTLLPNRHRFENKKRKEYKLLLFLAPLMSTRVLLSPKATGYENNTSYYFQFEDKQIPASTTCNYDHS
ncbi:MAG: hypothetical protein ACI977_000032 [Candidatus Nanohaloarchaea archaeon]|jgi:hypothetical protein